MMMDILFKNERGSASVIVILVMLLLTVFGVLAFVSAGSSLRLAEKNASTVQNYYRLDALGEEATAAASAALKRHVGEPADVLEKSLKQDTGLGSLKILMDASGKKIIEMDVSDSNNQKETSLHIRLSPKDGGGVVIREWRLNVQPFQYPENIGI